MRALLPRAAVAVCFFAICCAPEYSEVADWTIPLPEGTPIIEQKPVQMEQREGKRIELVKDLVIGGRRNDPDYLFYFEETWGKKLAVDHAGRIYVLDGANSRVQVFDTQGTHLRTLGRQGSGPGEFLRMPWLIAVAGEQLFVSYPRHPHMDVWDLAGEYRGRREVSDASAHIRKLVGTDSGDLFVAYDVPHNSHMWRRNVRLVRLSLQDSSEFSYLERADPQEPAVTPAWRLALPLMKLGLYRPTIAASREGQVYLTTGDEYQILALEADGSARWALRAKWQRHVPSEDEIDTLIEQLHQAGNSPEDQAFFKQRSRVDIGVLGPWPALAGINVDGHGHVYVFPETLNLPGTGAERPVDVYSEDGAHLFSGSLPVAPVSVGPLSLMLAAPLMPRDQTWSAALGDYVYRVEDDPSTGEGIVVRYRLVEPF